MDRFVTSMPLGHATVARRGGSGGSGCGAHGARSGKRLREEETEGDAEAGAETDSRRSELDGSLYSRGAGSARGSGKAAVQMYLDLGQRSFGRTRSCPRCGMVLVQGDLDDERRHAAFCASANSDVVKLQTESNCKLLVDENNIRILEYVGPRNCAEGKRETTARVRGTTTPATRAARGTAVASSTTAISAYDRVLGIVCRALGTPLEPLPPSVRVFFAVEDSYIIGFLSTEAVRRPDLSWLRRGEETSQVEVRSEAVASDSGARLDLQRYQNEGGKVEPSDIPEVALGVRQVWVREPYRGRGVATILVDAARRAFLLGSAPRRQLVAFSQPTVEGARFAFAYAAAQDRMLTYSHAS